MNLFKTPSDRELWIKLNAERQIEREKELTYFDENSQTYKPTNQALHPRTMNEAIVISQRQCEYDEEAGRLRFTLEELLTLDIAALNAIQNKRHEEWCGKFESLK